MTHVIAWILVVSSPNGVFFSSPLSDQYSCEQVKFAVYTTRSTLTCVQVRVPIMPARLQVNE